jgi:hypothetical protein
MEIMVGFLASLPHLSKSKTIEHLRWVSEQNELKERARLKQGRCKILSNGAARRVPRIELRVLWQVNSKLGEYIPSCTCLDNLPYMPYVSANYVYYSPHSCLGVRPQ